MQALSSEPTPAAPRFYSVAQAARMFGMSAMTLYRAIAAGEFPAVRIRGRLIVPARAVEAMVDAAVAEQTVVDAAGWVPEDVRRG
jgi:excisionase family DNA binding protein